VAGQGHQQARQRVAGLVVVAVVAAAGQAVAVLAAKEGVAQVVVEALAQVGA